MGAGKGRWCSRCSHLVAAPAPTPFPPHPSAQATSTIITLRSSSAPRDAPSGMRTLRRRYRAARGCCDGEKCGCGDALCSLPVIRCLRIRNLVLLSTTATSETDETSSRQHHPILVVHIAVGLTDRRTFSREKRKAAAVVGKQLLRVPGRQAHSLHPPCTDEQPQRVLDWSEEISS